MSTESFNETGQSFIEAQRDDGPFGLITGSGFTDIGDLSEREERLVVTPFGEAKLTLGTWRSHRIAFVPRHGSAHRVAPHLINYRANIAALESVGVKQVIATAVSGAINRAYRLGELVLISDFLNFTSGRLDTLFDGTDPKRPFDPMTGHVDMTDVYCANLRNVICETAKRLEIELVESGTYCATNGPRFETPAEIKMMARLGGDLVGMTGYPEAALAKEAGMSYASIAVVSNPAAGLGEDIGTEEVFAAIKAVAEPLYQLITASIEAALAARS